MRLVDVEVDVEVDGDVEGDGDLDLVVQSLTSSEHLCQHGDDAFQ
jgi:hypothetical protein